MFIVPISKMPEIGTLEQVKKEDTVKSGEGSFQNILEQAMQETEQAIERSEELDGQLVTGNIDDLHSAMIQAEQTQASIEFTTQVMSKAVSAYNQIMAMQV